MEQKSSLSKVMPVLFGFFIMGVAWGAILPPLMGLASDAVGQVGGMLVIMAGMIYLLLTAYLVKVRNING
jgi:FHS family L-fucose permease-like MFS transporter